MTQTVFHSGDLWEDWEIIDILSLENYTTKSSKELCSFDEDYQPELSEESELLNTDECGALVPFLPARVRASPWKLVYSTSKHGYGINNLYRNVVDLESPTILVIKDFSDHVFGAILSCPPRNRGKFEGNGECAVFSCIPKLKVYQWSGSDYRVLMGSSDSIAVGCENGVYALWLDKDLYRGRTSACSTFGNDSLCPCVDFYVKKVELWTF